jgi:rhodanese-related sulfurtransferase
MMEAMVEVTRITPEEVKQRLDRGEKFTFVDARNEKDWSESGVKLPGAIRIPADEAEKRVGDLPKDRTVITYCT